MNRIIFIGNGFDLAHGLKTSYANFIDWYWDEWGKRLLSSHNHCEEDELVSFETTIKMWNLVPDWFYIKDDTISAHSFIEKIRKDNGVCSITIKSELFSTICKLRETKWVDIEDEYFKQLCNDNEKPEKVNKELFFLRNKLIDYLRSVQDVTGADLIKKEIRNKMIEPFKKQDISISAMDKWKYMFQERYNYQEREWMQVITSFLDFEKCMSFSDVESVYYNEIADFINKNAVYIENNTFDYIDENGIPDVFLLPNRVMLLNFNYTNIADFYLPHGPHFYCYLVNHIHGELSKPESIIFGYGDEIDENFKRLSNKNDNEYLKYVKSINYLESSNYRNLLEFIESDTYQIYIMGHSCGNSDRTLLNTLFEHRNCVSIKPFYHKWDDNTDNYMELVQNISRNFTDMKLMRDRVVNKTFCETI